MIKQIRAKDIIIQHILDCIEEEKNKLSDEEIAWHTGFSVQTVFKTIHWAAKNNVFDVERCSGRPSIYFRSVEVEK